MTDQQWCDLCDSLAVHSTEAHAGWIVAAANVCEECGGFGLHLRGCTVVLDD